MLLVELNVLLILFGYRVLLVDRPNWAFWLTPTATYTFIRVNEKLRCNRETHLIWPWMYCVHGTNIHTGRVHNSDARLGYHIRHLRFLPKSDSKPDRSSAHVPSLEEIKGGNVVTAQGSGRYAVDRCSVRVAKASV